MPVRINPDLQGWPWAADTFSWVEPTAYALIALQKLRSALPGTAALERMRQGELLLYDRMCAGGDGITATRRCWERISHPTRRPPHWPSLPCSSIQTAAPNQRSVHTLRAMLVMRRVGASAQLGDPVLDPLWSRYRGVADTAYAGSDQQTEFLGETKTLALALLALGAGSRAFRIPTHA